MTGRGDSIKLKDYQLPNTLGIKNKHDTDFSACSNWMPRYSFISSKNWSKLISHFSQANIGSNEMSSELVFL